MGTVMTHKAFGRHAAESVAAACEEVARIEGLLSRFLPDSEISRVNRSAGIRREQVGRETYDVLSSAAEFSRCFAGCFDVTIGPLVSLWHRAKECLAEPDASSIAEALSLVDHRDLVLDPEAMTARLGKAGQSLDLGGIGKGFAADRIVGVFGEFGITSAYSNLGGNVVTVGRKPDGNPWQIGIQHPRDDNRLIGAVSVIGETVVTSGDYQRTYTDSRGKRHHHILDPTTGYPASSGLVSVSIVTEASVWADPLSTIVFVAGKEKGVGFLKSHPRTEAILVDTDLNVYVTQGLRSRFQAAEEIEVAVLD
jgi:thiamine biosynthesis lipoprotein